MLLPLFIPGPERVVYRDHTVDVKFPKAENRYTAKAQDISEIYVAGISQLEPLIQQFEPTYKTWMRLKREAVDNLYPRHSEETVRMELKPDREKYGIFAGFFSPKEVEKEKSDESDWAQLFRLDQELRILQTECDYDHMLEHVGRFRSEVKSLSLVDTVDLTAETVALLNRIKDGSLAKQHLQSLEGLEKQVNAAADGQPAWLGF